MADYKGSSGIEALKAKIKLKSKMLVGESLEKIAIELIDDSPVGEKYYQSPTQGRAVPNEQGDFKNSWQVSFNTPDKSVRGANAQGTEAVVSAIATSSQYNLQDISFVTNSINYAEDVEDGWDDNPEYGWRAKKGYEIVQGNVGKVVTILQTTADKVSKM